MHRCLQEKPVLGTFLQFQMLRFSIKFVLRQKDLKPNTSKCVAKWECRQRIWLRNTVCFMMLRWRCNFLPNICGKKIQDSFYWVFKIIALHLCRFAKKIQPNATVFTFPTLAHSYWRVTTVSAAVPTFLDSLVQDQGSASCLVTYFKECQLIFEVTEPPSPSYLVGPCMPSTSPAMGAIASPSPST